MSIPLSGNAQSLFNRLGIIIARCNQIQDLINTYTVEGVSAIAAIFATPAADTQLINNLYSNEAAFQNTPQSWLSYLQSLMQNTCIQMAQDDVSGYANTTPGIVPYSLGSTSSLYSALVKIIQQMKTASATIQKPTLSITITPHLTVGNGVLVASTIDYDGLQLDYILGETLSATCTNDGYPGNSAQPGSEPFLVEGQNQAASIFAFNFPQGSGASISITSLNTSATNGLLINDGDFETWAGTPLAETNWTRTVGTWGTSIVRSAVPYTGSYAMSFVGDGSTENSIYQVLPSGSSGIQPNTVYAMNIWMAINSTSSTGSITISLTDGNSNILQNDQGVNCSKVINVSALTTSYANFYAFFQTPAVLPAVVQIVISNTTAAIASGHTVLMDAIGLQKATQIYIGGPWMALFKGSTNFAINDYFNIAVTTTANNNTFAQQLNRYIGLASNAVKIPSASSPSIPDSLVVAFPYPPTGFTATLVSTTVDFALTSPGLNGASTYNIYRNGSTFSGSTGLSFSALNSFTDSPGSGNWTYQVAGVDAQGNVGFLSTPTTPIHL